MIQSKMLFGPLFVAFALLFGSSAIAQNYRFPTNTRVQLPVVSVFNVRTTVMVPDGGIMSLGGVTRHAEGSISRGVPGLINRPFTNRNAGYSTSSNRASVKVTVLSGREWESSGDFVDRSRAGRLSAGSAELQRKAAFLSRNVGRSALRR